MRRKKNCGLSYDYCETVGLSTCHHPSQSVTNMPSSELSDINHHDPRLSPSIATVLANTAAAAGPYPCATASPAMSTTASIIPPAAPPAIASTAASPPLTTGSHSIDVPNELAIASID